MTYVYHRYSRLLMILALLFCADRAAAQSTYYISPSGDDANTGISSDAPWKTFDRAVSALKPGDVLYVMDGTYTPETTGLIHVDTEQNAVNGTAEAPITIRAMHERRAFLRSDGLVAGVSLNNCEYWQIIGLRIRGRDNSTEVQGNYHMAVIGNSRRVLFRRNLVTHSNREGWNSNQQLLWIGYSSDVLVEENEFYYHHRHAANAWKSEGIVFRRNYINPRDWNGGEDFSDEALVFYQSSSGIMENNITEGYNLGFQAHGGVTYTGKEGGSYNRFFGNISIGGHNGTRLDARLAPHPTHKPALDNHFKDYLIIDSRAHGLWLSSTTRTMAENITVTGAGGAGIGADQRKDNPCDVLPDGCSFTLRNTLVFGNRIGVSSMSQTDWKVGHANVYGNGTNYRTSEPEASLRRHLFRTRSEQPTGMGLDEGECIVFVPGNSNMSGVGKDGADLGANILYRYRDGELTDEPLWDPETGAFPHGAVIEGINDVAGASAFDVHERLNVNTNGCTLPYSKSH